MLRSDGKATACGNSEGQERDHPTLDPGLTNTQVSAREAITALPRSDGTPTACGNSDGQGDQPPLDPGLTYTQVSASDHHTVMLRSDGKATTCGNGDGQERDHPTLDPGLTNTQVSTGEAHSSDSIATAYGSQEHNGPFWLPAAEASAEDDLIVLWDNLPTQPQESLESAYDSQLTMREEPETPPASPPPAPRRWHEWPLTWATSDEFWNLVAAEDLRLRTNPWYHADWFWRRSPPPEDYEACVEMASCHIGHDLLPRAEQIKIGITEDIGRRWEQMSADRRGGWRELHLLYAAPTSKTIASLLDDERVSKLKATSTGAFETRLISDWSPAEQCVNRSGAGGECPSAGSPHYVYVVLR
jgi:hypothetical protein